VTSDRTGGGITRSGLESTERGLPGGDPGGPQLLIVAADGTWRSRPLPTPGALTIGRSAEADIRIRGRAVSRQHARLEATAAGELRLLDLGSYNGTFVDGERVRGAGVTVRPGASITIGGTRLAVYVPVRSRAPEEDPRSLPGQELVPAWIEAIVAKVAPTSINVLLLGEPLAGRQATAERIHRLSLRAQEPLVQLRCAALTPALLESELAGHERRAFTIFLDEVGEMSAEVQARLVLALERRDARGAHAAESRPLNVRLISGTSRDLEAEIRGGRFSAELYHRISGLPIRISPPRDRTGESAGPAAASGGDAPSRPPSVPRCTALATASAHAANPGGGATGRSSPRVLARAPTRG